MAGVMKIIVVWSMCAFASYFVLAKLTPHAAELRKYMIASIAILSVTALTRNVLLGYFATIFIALHFTKGADESHKIAFFFGVAFTLTMTNGFHINPGVNLGSLTYQRILLLTLIVPLYLAKKDPAMKKLNAIDKAVIAFFIWQFLLNFRVSPITGAVRMNLWLVIDFIIPYLVMRYFIKDYSLLFAAISFAFVAQMSLGIIEGLSTWHVHTHLEMLAGFTEIMGSQYKFRHGFLRVQAAFSNPLTYALFGNIAFCCALLYFKRLGMENMPKAKLFTFGVLGVTAAGTFFSGSRAGMAGLVLVFIIYTVLMWAVKKKKDPKKMMVVGAVITITIVLIAGGDFIKDEFGYRYQLIDVSRHVIMDNFLFGQTNPTGDPRMEVLRQGEGIIDLVNTYVMFALFYGMPALLMFVYAIFASLNRLYNYLREAEGEKLTIGVFAFVSIALLAFNIGTTSAIGWSYPWIWMSLCIASNIVARADAEKREVQVNQNSNLL